MRTGKRSVVLRRELADELTSSRMASIKSAAKSFVELREDGALCAAALCAAAVRCGVEDCAYLVEIARFGPPFVRPLRSEP